MEKIQVKLESWIKEQREKMMKVSWRPFQWGLKWPPWTSVVMNRGNDRKRIQEEYERQKQKLHQLCLAVKADSVSELQEILCCMVLAECVYKRPAAELLRAVNKFKADFGGQLVSLERVQPSSDHVPHRYLLAETGDTLFASFIGTKQYKDIVTDVNILQGAIFNDDSDEKFTSGDALESGKEGKQLPYGELRWHPLDGKTKGVKGQPKPAAHRGFMARAKGIPALELYKLAQKKNRKLVLCGHSLGGAVAALATLSILRTIATLSSNDNAKFEVKCITFSQPPVGNSALKDYVHRKGWQHHFKSYCIPEDLVPRILSPAYFQHYNSQSIYSSNTVDANNKANSTPDRLTPSRARKQINNGSLVLGLGPVQTSLWRLSKLVPIDGLRKRANVLEEGKENLMSYSGSPSTPIASMANAGAPQSLEIQEDSDGISLRPMLEYNGGSSDDSVDGKSVDKRSSNGGISRNWNNVPSLPSYVPFGKLYLLGNGSVDLLSGAEYSKLTSVKSVIAELKERLQSHSMRAYRSRFQRIYETCMGEGNSTFLGMEQLPQFSHLQELLGVSIAGAVELADVVDSPIIKTATSLVPLGWSGTPGDKHCEPIKVDVMGFRLHLCTLVHAQINGNWCSTAVESCPSPLNEDQSVEQEKEPRLQRMRVLVGAPLKKPPSHLSMADSLLPAFPSMDSVSVPLRNEDPKPPCPEGFNAFSIHCTTDFATVSKDVSVRTRRVRLVGLEGAGKTSLYKAIMNQCRTTPFTNLESFRNVHDGVADGVWYSDAAGVNLQDLKAEVACFRDELRVGAGDIGWKTDLIILVHNLSHKIPRWGSSTTSQQQPVLSLLIEEAKGRGIPWVLAITNKFSVSAHQQKEAIDAAMHAYRASEGTTVVLNSCSYVMPTASATLSWAPSSFRAGPIALLVKPFQSKDVVLPIEGVRPLAHLVHRVLRTHEEDSLKEFANDRLLAELARGRSSDLANQTSGYDTSSLSAAAVGASLGAGLGIVLAIVMGAASGLRKP